MAHSREGLGTSACHVRHLFHAGISGDLSLHCTGWFRVKALPKPYMTSALPSAQFAAEDQPEFSHRVSSRGLKRHHNAHQHVVERVETTLKRYLFERGTCMNTFKELKTTPLHFCEMLGLHSAISNALCPNPTVSRLGDRGMLRQAGGQRMKRRSQNVQGEVRHLKGARHHDPGPGSGPDPAAVPP